jgi:ADP-ribose pyrophosphatase YjhB (NUDIX family)
MKNKTSSGRVYSGPMLTTDIVIEHENCEKEGIVLITRKNFPRGIALPGGFAEKGITLEENAIKEAKEETNLNVVLETPERPLCVHSHPDRDPRAHIATVVYVAQGYGTLRSGDDAKTAGLYTVDEVKSLLGRNEFAFYDHERIIQKYLRYRGYEK